MRPIAWTTILVVHINSKVALSQIMIPCTVHSLTAIVSQLKWCQNSSHLNTTKQFNLLFTYPHTGCTSFSKIHGLLPAIYTNLKVYLKICFLSKWCYVRQYMLWPCRPPICPKSSLLLKWLNTSSWYLTHTLSTLCLTEFRCLQKQEHFPLKPRSKLCT